MRTYTFVTMKVSARAYAEIRKRMVEDGYSHAIGADGRDGERIDMNGLALQAMPAPPPSGELMVGLSEAGDEVVINHPDLLTDADGVGHIVFSASQARALATILNKHADRAERK